MWFCNLDCAHQYHEIKNDYCDTNQFRVQYLGRTLPHQAPLYRNAPGHPESSGPVVKSIRFRIVAHPCPEPQGLGNPEAGRSPLGPADLPPLVGGAGNRPRY